MKITESQLRRIIREEILQQGQRSPRKITESQLRQMILQEIRARLVEPGTEDLTPEADVVAFDMYDVMTNLDAKDWVAKNILQHQKGAGRRTLKKIEKSLATAPKELRGDLEQFVKLFADARANKEIDITDDQNARADKKVKKALEKGKGAAYDRYQKAGRSA